MSENTTYSIVGPVWNEEGNLPEFYKQIKEAMDSLQGSWELILINDGSADNSWQIMEMLHQQDARVKIINFAKNFGQQNGFTAGIDYASGEAVILIDTDLQDPPAVIVQLIKKWEEGFEVVYAVRSERRGESWFKKATAALFYRLIQSITSVDIPLDAGDFRLIDRKVVNMVKSMREHHRFLRGLTSWVGFRQIGVEYVRSERFAGETGYPFRTMLKLAISAITGFSSLPLQIATVMGFLIAGLSAVFGIFVVFTRSFLPGFFEGQATTLVSVLFLGGVQLITLGIIGEYLSRIYDEVRGRPLYVVNEVRGFEDTENRR